jgi:tetratricopeptide (TPR) repeat protein
MSPVISRVLIITLAVSLVVLLFFAPHKTSSPDQPKTGPMMGLNTEVKLSPDQQKMYDGLKLALDNAGSNADKQKALEGLAAFFEQNKKPLQVAVYYMKLAELQNTAQAWLESGERFYRAAGFVEDTLVGTVYQNAITAYGKSLELDPANANAKMKMGVCYVEAQIDPMKGVGMIKEVADNDPKNIDAQLNLGFFSVKSKQFDKALVRFNNVLKIDTGYADAWVYLAQTYEMMGDTVNAITDYERYSRLVKDTLVSSQVKDYVKKLKDNKTN